MQSIRPLSVPDRTAEEWAQVERDAAAFRESMAFVERMGRITRSGIPAEFRRADDMLPEVEAWTAGPGYGLILQGRQGRGKTYQACAALKALASEGSVLFRSFGDIVREWESVRNDMATTRQVMNSLTAARALVLDNLGRERMNSFTAPLLAELIDKRTQAVRPTIITTTLDGRAFYGWLAECGNAEIAKDVSSRLKRYAYVEVKGGDRRAQ